MPLSMSATTTERLPVVTPQACGAWIFVMSYCWANDGSLGTTWAAGTTADRPEADRTVRVSSSSTRGRARRERGETWGSRRTRRERRPGMGRLLGRTGLREVMRRFYPPAAGARKEFVPAGARIF